MQRYLLEKTNLVMKQNCSKNVLTKTRSADDKNLLVKTNLLKKKASDDGNLLKNLL
jgi:hypothetical protein